MIAQIDGFTGPGAAEVAAHVLFYAGIVALIGAGVAGARVFDDAPRRLRRGLAIAWTVAAAGAGFIAILRYRDIGDLGVFLSAPLGRAALVRTLALLAAHEAMLVALLAKPRTSRRGYLAVAIFASVSAFGHTLSSHAGVGENPAIKLAVQGLHIAAVGAWIGGLGMTLLCLRGEPEEHKTRAVERFSRLAGIAIVVVAITGALRAINEIGGIMPLVETTYGRITLAKIELLLLLAALGATNRFRHVPAARRTLKPLRRTGATEVVVAMVVLGLTGVLSGTAPAREVYAKLNEFPTKPVAVLVLPNGPTLYDVDLGQGRSIQTYFDPDEPGKAEMHLTFFGTDGKEAQVDDVVVTISAGGRVAGKARRFTKGHFLVDVVREAGDASVRIEASLENQRIRAAFTLPAG